MPDNDTSGEDRASISDNAPNQTADCNSPGCRTREAVFAAIDAATDESAPGRTIDTDRFFESLAASGYLVQCMSQDQNQTSRPFDKIASGLKDAVAIIKRAKEIDPPAWRDYDRDGMRERRFAAVHKANQEMLHAS